MPFRFNPFTKKLDLVDTSSGPPPSSEQVIVLKSSLADMTDTTPQLLFTSPSDGPFVVTSIIAYAQNIDNASVAPTYNIGWTVPDYDDLLIGASDGILSTNQYIFQTPQGVAGVPSPIPASTDVYVDSITPATADAYETYYYFMGYILF